MTHATSERARLGACLALCLGAQLLTACCHEPVVSVSDSPVVIAGRAGGGILARPRPADGKVLAAELTRESSCIPGERLLALLGPTCDHQSENFTPQRSTGDLDGGIPKPTDEVRWYCAGRLVVRVVWTPCDANGDGKLDGITPLEVSVATHPPQE